MYARCGHNESSAVERCECPMPRNRDDDMYYQPPEALHYNIQLKGGGLNNRVTMRGFEGLKPGDIDWVWIVEERRRATTDEIRKLCKGPPQRMRP
jgi:hypothetical protein